jgi:hypothetical protein
MRWGPYCTEMRVSTLATSPDVEQAHSLSSSLSYVAGV